MSESTKEEWRAEAARQAARVEDLEHEVGRLREVLRRLFVYIDSIRSGVA